MLHERLGIIDNAHKNLTDLTSQVTTLRDVLANKQSRGAFGQARMEAIVQDGMPKGAYEFQHTLSTGKRPDCVVFLPDQRPLCIDAKFPLEAMTALHDARSDEEKKYATQRLRADVMKHVSDIAEKYLIAGETQDTALMFVPSESVYAEIHDGFDDVIQKAYRARVVLVSPSLLMLAIQVMQQILKDARMRDAADQIRTEVLNLGDDLNRLRDRVLKLQKHFGDVNEDVRQILISADKIEKRAGRIEELDFSKTDAAGRDAADRQAGRRRAVPAGRASCRRGSRGDAFFPSPLVGEDGARSTTDEGSRIRGDDPSPVRMLTHRATLSHKGRGEDSPNLLALRHDSAPEAPTKPRHRPAPPGAKRWAVYLQPRVLIVLLLGFSSGLPLALSGSTLLVWMREIRRRPRAPSGCSRWSARPTRSNSCGRRWSMR